MNETTIPEEEIREAAEKFAQAEHRDFWRDREAGFLAGVEWHVAKHAEEMKEKVRLAYCEGQRDSKAEIERLSREIERKQKALEIVYQDLTAAREREEKAVALCEAIRVLEEIPVDETHCFRRGHQQKGYIAEQKVRDAWAAYDASRAATKEGA